MTKRFLGAIPPQQDSATFGDFLRVLALAIAIFLILMLLAHYLYLTFVVPAFGLPKIDAKTFLATAVVVRLVLGR